VADRRVFTRSAPIKSAVLPEFTSSLDDIFEPS
jgi:hypothetical protein